MTNKRNCVIKMLNFNQSDPSIGNPNFPCQMDQPTSNNGGSGGDIQTSSASSGQGTPSVYSATAQDQQCSSYPLLGSFTNSLGSGRVRSSSPERFFENSSTTTLLDSVQQTSDSLFPFVMPSAKGSENVKRFSVNNLLQLAQCTSATNILSSSRSMGKFWV